MMVPVMNRTMGLSRRLPGRLPHAAKPARGLRRIQSRITLLKGAGLHKGTSPEAAHPEAANLGAANLGAALAVQREAPRQFYELGVREVFARRVEGCARRSMGLRLGRSRAHEAYR